MIWATVSSQSCFGCLYRVSPSLAAKNILSLISVLTIWWCPLFRAFSFVVGKGCLLWSVCSLGKTILTFALLHSVLQGKLCQLLQVEKEMTTHSSILAWRIPGTDEPSGLPSMGSHRIGHNWRDLAGAAAACLSVLLSVNLNSDSDYRL